MRRRAGREQGQVLVLLALGATVLIGLSALALDIGTGTVQQQSEQQAADQLAMAAASNLSEASPRLLSAAPVATDPAWLTAAVETLDTGDGCGSACAVVADCPTQGSGAASGFDLIFTDLGCSTAGWTTELEVTDPPRPPSGTILPAVCQGSGDPYNCVGVELSHRQAISLGQVVGLTSQVISAWAVAEMVPDLGDISLPSPVAVTLYPNPNPWNSAQPASRSNLLCANCPSLQDDSGAALQGQDAALAANGQEGVALLSGGPVEIGSLGGGICDPSLGTCPGADGLAVLSGDVYCTGEGYCTEPGPGGDAEGPLAAAEVTSTLADPPSWSPTVTTTGLPDCGALELDGASVAASYALAGSVRPAASGCSTDTNLLQPGVYSYIVINHGSYSFAPGLYDITGLAPTGVIDHSGEVDDTDLCSANQASCDLTAGVWITASGSGPATQVTGQGVSFLLQRGGFVATHEVQSLELAAPAVGAAEDVDGAPLLIDLQAAGFIHLDAQDETPDTLPRDSLSGLLYQAPGLAGGVELSASLGSPGLSGQVMAGSLYLFSDSPSPSPTLAVDFRDGYSQVSPLMPRQPEQDSGLLTQETLSRDPTWGWADLNLTYEGTTPLDAYRLYVAQGLNAPDWFSAGLWPPAYTGQGPPAVTVYPMLPPPDPPYVSASGGGWTYGFPDGSSLTVSGDWTWGPSAPAGGPFTAQITYRFQLTSASTLTLTAGLVSGADLAGAGAFSPGVVTALTFISPDQPGGSAQGSNIVDPGEQVDLVQ
jgi:hypothetical protein